MKTIRCKLTNEKGDVIIREDGTVLTFILIDEAELREILRREEAFHDELAKDRVEVLKEILGD